MDEPSFEQQTTTIQITQRSKHALIRIKGELIGKDGFNRTFDDVIQDMVYYWMKGVKRRGYGT